VPPATPAALAEALLELARNPARHAACGSAGRARVEERFSLRTMVANYRRVCLGEGPNAGTR
jgi:glycosyltransferase involved in cell wall biosynthesis